MNLTRHAPSLPDNWTAALFDQLEQGLFVFDARGLLQAVNPRGAALLGQPATTLCGKRLTEVLLLQEPGDLFAQLPEPGERATLALQDPAGRPFWLEISAGRFQPENAPAPLTAPMTAPLTAPMTALLLRDVSDQESSRNLGSYFLANISHEFRTPISALNASVELLLEELANLSLAEIAQLLNSIHLSVTGLQTLIDNLLESTLIAAGHFRIRRRKADLGQIIRTATQVMQPLLDRRHQQLATEIQPGLPPQFTADPTRLQQVLVNLLSNASKYSPMEANIRLDFRLAGSDLRVSVTDQGPGIADEARQQVFQRFVRLSNQDGTQPGIGLGLSVVKTIVEAHGGRVGVEPAPAGGSVFWFSIPLEAPHPEAKSA